MQSDIPMGERLTHFLPFCRRNVRDESALQVVSVGYLLLFIQVLPFHAVRWKKAFSALDEQVLEEEINSLLQGGL